MSSSLMMKIKSINNKAHQLELGVLMVIWDKGLMIVYSRLQK